MREAEVSGHEDDVSLDSKSVPDEREGDQTQSDMPPVKGKDRFADEETPRPASGEPTLPAGSGKEASERPRPA